MVPPHVQQKISGWQREEGHWVVHHVWGEHHQSSLDSRESLISELCGVGQTLQLRTISSRRYIEVTNHSKRILCCWEDSIKMFFTSWFSFHLPAFPLKAIFGNVELRWYLCNLFRLGLSSLRVWSQKVSIPAREGRVLNCIVPGRILGT